MSTIDKHIVIHGRDEPDISPNGIFEVDSTDILRETSQEFILEISGELPLQNQCYWCHEIVPYHDERVLAVWTLLQLGLVANFPIKLIKEFVNDWFKLPSRFYDLSRQVNSAVSRAEQAALVAEGAARAGRTAANKARVAAALHRATDRADRADIGYSGETAAGASNSEYRIKVGYGIHTGGYMIRQGLWLADEFITGQVVLTGSWERTISFDSYMECRAIVGGGTRKERIFYGQKSTGKNNDVLIYAGQFVKVGS